MKTVNHLQIVNMAKSLRSLIEQSSPDLDRISNLILQSDYKAHLRTGKPVPPYLKNFCKNCGSYSNVVEKEGGLVCERCISIEPTQPQGKLPKLEIFVMIKSKGKNSRRVAILKGHSMLDIVRDYSNIAKKQGFGKWIRDPNASVVYGFYENDAGDKITLSSSDALPSPKRPTR